MCNVELKKDVMFVVPQSLYVGESTLIQQKLSTRVAKPLGKIIMKAVIQGEVIGEEEVEDAVPAEMIHVKID